jgi:hypothetical protein
MQAAPASAVRMIQSLLGGFVFMVLPRCVATRGS